jgi:hypothetical protein
LRWLHRRLARRRIDDGHRPLRAHLHHRLRRRRLVVWVRILPRLHDLPAVLQDERKPLVGLPLVALDLDLAALFLVGVQVACFREQRIHARGVEDLEPVVPLQGDVVEVLALLLGARLVLRPYRRDLHDIVAVGKDAGQTGFDPLDCFVYGTIHHLGAPVRCRLSVSPEVVIERLGPLGAEIAVFVGAVGVLLGCVNCAD